MSVPEQFRFVIHEADVRRFAEAAWDSNPAFRYRDSASPIAVPAMFACCAATLSGRPHSVEALGFDIARAFHGTETITLVRPLAVGQVITVHESTTLLPPVTGRRGGSMRQALRRSELRDAAGVTLGHTTRLLLEAAQVPVAQSPGARHPIVDVSTLFDDGLRLRPDPAPANPRNPAELTPGDIVGDASFGPLTRADIVRYAAASGDLTAIHFDEFAAGAHGYPTVFAMGMLSAAFVGHVLTSWLVVTTPSTLSVRFREQVWPGDTLRVRARVAERQGQQATIDVTCTVDETVVTSARLVLG